MRLVEFLEKPNKELFFSKGDPKDPRLGEIVKRWENEEELLSLLSSGADAVIIGIPDDTGIIRNKGREGAKKGPDAVRKKFYTLTPGCISEIDKLKIVDIGNVKIEEDIEKTHQNVEKVVEEITKMGIIPIIIGGGHDFAHPVMEGLIRGYSARKNGELKYGRINTDSHFDVRDLTFRLTSGVPFYLTLEMEGNPVLGKNFVEFGFQEHHNAKVHYDYLVNKGATIIALEEIQRDGLEKCWNKAKTIAEEGTEAVGLSIDIDAARVSDAPGASAAYPNGFTAAELEKIAYLAGRDEKIKMLDIFEICPLLDIDNRTAALGASIMFYFLRGVKERLRP